MSSISLSKRVVLSPEHLSVQLGKDTVILHMAEGVYYNLNPIAKRIWSLMENPVSIQEIVDTVMSEYEVDQDTCVQAVTNFVDQLVMYHLATELTNEA